ncbi:MAG: tRNA pseudouridine(55) synthase TruB [Deltaproteobacteria bacterium]|nr:MAG: tRNA pseudouridine(55) synthase TruB [Deltaproteobacteria bacterium]
MIGGVLVVDKPKGLTSFDVLRRLRRHLGTKRIGHAGTLDPMATGVLVVAFGASTRLVPWLMAGEKTYEARVLLGRVTTTDDVEGETLRRERVSSIDRTSLEQVLNQFRGVIRQRPPSFSAIRVDGERSHRRARRGETVVLPEREVIVHDLVLLGAERDELRLRCRVGSGTYVRSLARDIGEALGCGGTLSALRRTAVEPFPVSDALTLSALDDDPELVASSLLTPWEALARLPAVRLDDEEARRVSHGQRRAVPEAALADVARADGPDSVIVRVGSPEGRLVAVAEVRPSPEHPEVLILHPLRVFPER